MPKFDFTITFSSILLMATMVTTAYASWMAFKSWMSVKIAIFEETLKAHTASLEAHAARLNKHEEVHTKLIADVQKVVVEVGMLLKYWAPQPGDRRSRS